MLGCAPTVVVVGTGIVFVVLVAIWAAYFVQYWSRRREHLATARSVEAFSEAMRVLERRPARHATANDRISTAYSVSPARVISRPAPRPQVMAKPRPAPTGGDPAMRLPDSLPKISVPTFSAVKGSLPKRGAKAASPAQKPVGRGSGPTPSRKVRGLVLLASLAATLVLGGLAAFSVVVWWAPLVALGVVVASFFWLRSAVQAEIRARRAARSRVRRTRAGARPAGTAATAVAGGAAGSAEEHEVADLAVGRELIEDSMVVADAGAQATGFERPDGWQPVPVPPPTYTLKAKAERPAPVVAEDDVPESPGFAAPDFAPSSQRMDGGAEADEATAPRTAYGT